MQSTTKLVIDHRGFFTLDDKPLDWSYFSEEAYKKRPSLPPSNIAERIAEFPPHLLEILRRARTAQEAAEELKRLALASEDDEIAHEATRLLHRARIRLGAAWATGIASLERKLKREADEAAVREAARIADQKAAEIAAAREKLAEVREQLLEAARLR